MSLTQDLKLQRVEKSQFNSIGQYSLINSSKGIPIRLPETEDRLKLASEASRMSSKVNTP